jgi:hypothetical protein
LVERSWVDVGECAAGEWSGGSAGCSRSAWGDWGDGGGRCPRCSGGYGCHRSCKHGAGSGRAYGSNR